ncbi:hypothetical protein TNCV_1312151 [Trichonephila clavipes]|nr:hypothetical protein TNCV_1312151 [Trichonephila clavipes]
MRVIGYGPRNYELRSGDEEIISDDIILSKLPHLANGWSLKKFNVTRQRQPRLRDQCFHYPPAKEPPCRGLATCSCKESIVAWFGHSCSFLTLSMTTQAFSN